MTTLLAHLSELPLSRVPAWVVVPLALGITWPGLLGCIYRVLSHYNIRMIVHDAQGQPVRVTTRYGHLRGGDTYIVEVNLPPVETASVSTRSPANSEVR